MGYNSSLDDLANRFLKNWKPYGFSDKDEVGRYFFMAIRNRKISGIKTPEELLSRYPIETFRKPEEQKIAIDSLDGIRRGLEDLRAGRIREVRSPEDLLRKSADFS